MKNEWKIDSDLAKKIHEKWMGGGPVVPVFNEPKVEMIHMDTVHEWQLKDNDVIILTFDTEIWSPDEVKQMFDAFIEAFPHHKILVKYNGVEIDIVHTEKNESEVNW